MNLFTNGPPFKTAFLAVAALSAPIAWSAGFTGTYVASGPRVSFLVQLVESSGGSVVGRFKVVELDKDNKLQRMEAPLSGAASGDQLVAKIEAGWLQGGNLAVSLKKIPGGLQLTGSGMRANLRLGTEEDEAGAIANLGRESRQATAEKEAQEKRRQQDSIVQRRGEGIGRLLNAANAYVERGSRTYQNFNDYPARYDATTKKIQNIFEQLKSSRNIGERSTLSASMLHAKIDGTEHPHIEVRHAFEASMKDLQWLEEGFAAADKACSESAPASIDASTFQAQCAKLPAARKSVAAAGESSKAGFFQIRDVYRGELAKQEAMVSQADRMVR